MLIMLVYWILRFLKEGSQFDSTSLDRKWSIPKDDQHKRDNAESFLAFAFICIYCHNPGVFSTEPWRCAKYMEDRSQLCVREHQVTCKLPITSHGSQLLSPTKQCLGPDLHDQPCCFIANMVLSTFGARVHISLSGTVQGTGWSKDSLPVTVGARQEEVNSAKQTQVSQKTAPGCLLISMDFDPRAWY